MCFGSRNDRNDRSDDPPPRPAQQQQQQQDVKPKMSYNAAQRQEYDAPSGPPPGRSQKHLEAYQAPVGPPPGHRSDDYAPPAGPPLGHHHGSDDYAPPPGAPPGHDWQMPPPALEPSSTGKSQHDWESVVPDTSLFPPPPAIFSGHDFSTTNATEEESVAGERWCDQYHLSQPIVLDEAGRIALQANNIGLMEPAVFHGKLNWLSAGVWEGSTDKNSPDRCIISYPPLYVVNEHDPTKFNRPRTIYYEFKLRPGSKTNFIAAGFTALPYPSFRMPGWHRGSLAIHGDDGRRYINDTWGGKDFTDEIRIGDVYGIGMTLAPSGTHRPNVNIFWTRNGVQAGGWDLHEESDAESDRPVTGLEGFHDLCCAIGTSDAVSFEVIFDPERWLFQGARR